MTTTDTVAIVTTVHIPFAVVLASVVLVAGIAFMVVCTVRYRRTLRHGWIMASIATAVVVLMSAAVLIAYFLRR